LVFTGLPPGEGYILAFQGKYLLQDLNYFEHILQIFGKQAEPYYGLGKYHSVKNFENATMRKLSTQGFDWACIIKPCKDYSNIIVSELFDSTWIPS